MTCVGKGNFLDHALQEQQGVRRRPARIYRQHTNARAVIYGGVLVHSGCNFAGVHLDPLAGDEPGVPRATVVRAAWPRQGFDIHGPQDLFDCGSGYGEIVNSLEFALDPSRPQTTFAQLANPFAVLIKNLHRRRELGFAAPRGQTFHSLFPVSPDPLSQCRSRYTAFQANHAAVLQAEKQLHPPEPLATFCVHSCRVAGNNVY